MGKQTSTDVRELVLKFQNEGKTFREIGSIINRSHNTVMKIVDKYNKFGKIESRPTKSVGMYGGMLGIWFLLKVL